MLDFSPEWPWQCAIHPSGKRMAFLKSRDISEVWAYENVLPPTKAGK
jgi:hypothetical protein